MTAVEMREKTVDSVEDLKSLFGLSDMQIFEIPEVPRERKAVIRLFIEDEMRELDVSVVGETLKRYRVRIGEVGDGLGWIGVDNTMLVPKGAIRFVEVKQ